MKFIKLALIASALALLSIACNDNASNTGQPSQGGGASAPTPAATSSQATSGAASPKPTAAQDELAHASSIYEQSCAICHGDTGKGGVVNIEGKKLKVPGLVEGHAVKATDEHFAKQIANGGDGMPAFKDKLKPEEINELVRFIRQRIQGPPAGQPVPPTAPAPKP